MNHRNLAAVAAAAALCLAAGCGGGDDDKQDSSRPSAAGQAVGGAGADGSGDPRSDGPEQSGQSEHPRVSEQSAKSPEAHSFEEVAALLTPVFGTCQSMTTRGDRSTELSAADKARGGTQKALCWYEEQRFSIGFLLIDADNSTLEAFHKQRDLYSSERVGKGFTVTLVGSANDEVEAKVEEVEERFKESGLLFLNREKDFAPRDGVQVTEAKTPGCRYTSVAGFRPMGDEPLRQVSGSGGG